MRIEGYLFDGFSSKPRLTTLTLNETKDFFTIDERTYALSELRIQPKILNVPRVFEFLNQRFETSDHDQVDSLEASLGKKNYIFKFEKSWKAVGAMTALSALIIYLFYTQIIPYAAKKVVIHTPQFVIDRIAKSTEEYLLFLDDKKNLHAQLSDEKLDQFDQAITDLQNMFPSESFKIKILYHPITNAFTLLDGTIYITSELIKKADSSDEILAVLLHEVAHYRLHHILENMAESSAINALVTFVYGGSNIAPLSNFILTSKYSRQKETAADQFAIDHLRQNDKNVETLATMIKKIAESNEMASKIPSFLSTHPNPLERIEFIKGQAKKTKSLITDD